ncbi:putative bifunctional diguanylate cyclase/phosphodiesterase [Photobacterium sp. TY1-4]|uniref:putative bifunctional diguanylate cyclase/phosphodiesterase n=1 Tax=Photobacterium sp. TY1-4 TaxID=2899122 RepID=UPI0021C16228|nr:EAL domain-containing protein [Photobacterium sp. TY1-4]UXI03305.1 EAL domain-containing protein [Photobacterium sp. TY1-4]
MRKVKILLVACMVLLFAISSVVSTQRQHQVSGLISLSIKTIGWSSSELEMETLKFMQALRRIALNDLSQEEVSLRFDLLWSRIDVLAAGEESRPFRNQPGATKLLQRFKRHLMAIEPEVFALKPGDQAARRLEQALIPFQQQVRNLNVQNAAGDKSWRDLQQISSLQHEANLFLLGLLLSGSILIFLLIRESTTNLKQALHDSLTGLANRHAFHLKLEQAIAAGHKHHTGIAALMLDMDGFKHVNDQLGHAVGDQLLQAIAALLKTTASSGNTVARLGGDEFGILLDQNATPASCRKLASQLNTALKQGITIQGHRLYPQLSIGSSFFPEDAMQPDILMRHADLAMHYAKHDPKTGYRRFEQPMEDKRQRFHTLAEDLVAALANNELQQRYQPIVCLKTQRIALVESLLRWHHAQYGDISPTEIVTVAERAGLAEQLNAWVLTTACAQSVAWRKSGLPAIRMSVNISPAMYTRYDLAGMLTRVLSQTGLPADQLVLEITEDTTMQDIDSSPQILSQLHHLGVELALDDFGTGYSSLSHLKSMPFQKLKIDKSFIQACSPTAHQANSFLRTIIRLGQSLGMAVVAEGIETKAQYEHLVDEGCQFGQGFWFHRPMTGDELAAILRERQQDNVSYLSNKTATERQV